jgi:hypothetical protein
MAGMDAAGLWGRAIRGRGDAAGEPPGSPSSSWSTITDGGRPGRRAYVIARWRRQFRQTRNDSWWARTNQTGSVCIAGQGRRDQRDPIRGAGVDRPTRRRRCLRLGPSGRVGMNAGQVHQRGRVAERAQDGGHAGACGRREATSIPRMSSIPAGSKAGSRARWIGKATILLPPRPTAACIARAAIVRPCGVAMEPG